MGENFYVNCLDFQADDKAFINKYSIEFCFFIRINLCFSGWKMENENDRLQFEQKIKNKIKIY